MVILRLALGVTFLVHGWPKLNPSSALKGPAGVAGFFKQPGVPLSGFFAWVVAVLETVGAGLLLLGIGTRLLAFDFVIDMRVAIVFVKRRKTNAAFMDPKVKGCEFGFVLLAQALALVFLGAGRIAPDPAIGL